METKLQQKRLIVKKSSIHGFGVFADEAIFPGDVVEECHTLFSDGEDKSFINYYFSVNDKNAIPLGFGCIYNHANDPNCNYQYDEARQTMIYTANRHIAKGDEIFVTYGNDWFDSRNAIVKTAPFWKKYWKYFCGVPLRAILATSSILGMIFFLKFLLTAA